jgi:hypothetical protein
MVLFWVAVAAAPLVVVFFTTVEVLSLLSLLTPLARRVFLVVAAALLLVAGARLVLVANVVDVAAELELVVDVAVAFRLTPARVAFAFSTIEESIFAAPRVVAGFVGDAGRAICDLAGDAGRPLGASRELDDVGERIWVGSLAMPAAGPRCLFLGFSMLPSFSLSKPASKSGLYNPSVSILNVLIRSVNKPQPSSSHVRNMVYRNVRHLLWTHPRQILRRHGRRSTQDRCRPLQLLNIFLQKGAHRELPERGRNAVNSDLDPRPKALGLLVVLGAQPSGPFGNCFGSLSAEVAPTHSPKFSLLTLKLEVVDDGLLLRERYPHPPLLDGAPVVGRPGRRASLRRDRLRRASRRCPRLAPFRPGWCHFGFW